MTNNIKLPIRPWLTQFFRPMCLLCECTPSQSLLCQSCHNELPWFDREVLPCSFEHLDVYAAFYYQYPIDRIIQQFKHHQQFDFLSLLAQCIHTLPRPTTPLTHTALVAVPLSKQRLAERGFNQSHLLAQKLSRYWQLPLWPGLERHKHTLRQQTLERSERLGNIQSAFRLSCAPPKHIILIDDVCTTGATLQQIAQLLKKQGCLSVQAYVIAYNPSDNLDKKTR